jgi:hypothetical protein
MKDIWTILSYPTATVAGYFAASASSETVANFTGSELSGTIAVLVGTGLVVGFLIDEVIPTYLHDVRAGGAGGGDMGGDIGGEMDDGDFDFE